MPKIMLVTYNDVDGIPVGRHESGDVVVYSGDYGRTKYAGIRYLFSRAQEDTAKETMHKLRRDLAADVQDIDEAYVYVGLSIMGGAMRLIQDLLKAGKGVRMVACCCDAEIKQEFARVHSISLIRSECGGRSTCARLVRELA